MDQAPFIAAHHKLPTDATAPLVFADWLDEQGRSKEAEALRFAIQHQYDPEDEAADAEAEEAKRIARAQQLRAEGKYHEADRLLSGGSESPRVPFTSPLTPQEHERQKWAHMEADSWHSGNDADYSHLPPQEVASRKRRAEAIRESVAIKYPEIPSGPPLKTSKIPQGEPNSVRIAPNGVELRGADGHGRRIEMPDSRVTQWAQDERFHPLVKVHQRLFNPSIPEGPGSLTIHASPKAAAAHAEAHGDVLVHPHVTWSPTQSHEDIHGILERVLKGEHGAVHEITNPLVQRALREPGGEVKVYHAATHPDMYKGATSDFAKERWKKILSKTKHIPHMQASGRAAVVLNSTIGTPTLLASVPATPHDVERARNHPDPDLARGAEGAVAHPGSSDPPKFTVTPKR